MQRLGLIMKFYENKSAPNPRRVRIFLAEKGIDRAAIEFLQIDIAAGENLSKEFTARNPMGGVPVLELDDGTCISESVAISRYFEEHHPAPPLFGRNSDERVKIEMWNRRMEFNLHAPVRMAFRHLSGKYADREPVIQAWGEASFAEAERMLAYMDTHLADNEFVAGERYSIADITALCAIGLAGRVQLQVGNDQPNLRRWYDSVTARPSASA